MATTTAGIADLYSQIVTDLIPFYDNQVLLPNPQLISNQYNIEGAVGNSLQIPITNSYSANLSYQVVKVPTLLPEMLRTSDQML